MKIENEIHKELRHLVKLADSRDFLKASKRKDISGYMKSAMEFLALECLEKSSTLGNSSRIAYHKEITRNSRFKISDAVFRSDRMATKTEADQIYEILINSKLLANKNAIMNLAKHIGLHVSINKKDSRVRAAKILAKAIACSSEQIKKKYFSIFNEMVHDQTKGWFDVIRTK